MDAIDALQELKAYCAREKQDLARWGSKISSMEAAQMASLEFREATPPGAIVRQPAGQQSSPTARPAGHHLRLVHGGKA